MESKSNAVKLGPWGGESGTEWATYIQDVLGIKKLEIRHAGAIDSISVKTVHKHEINGTISKWSPKFGGGGGERTSKVRIDWPDEIITKIEGHCNVFEPSSDGGRQVLRSLTLTTNKAKYGPYGRKVGTPFSLPVFGGKIVGFHGRAGWCIYSIGVYLSPIKTENPVGRKMYDNPDSVLSLTAMDFKEETIAFPRSMIPRWPLWGGIGGKPWDDGVFSGINEIIVHRTENTVHAISIEYDRNGKSICRMHGGSGGTIRDRMRFEHGNEFLTSISGFHGPVDGGNGFEMIKSLTLYTNKGMYGPLGEEIGKFFSSAANAGKVVGFFGRSGVYLDAVGLHVDYLQD